MTIEDMKIELGEYLEAAGFSDAYNQILSQKTDEEIYRRADDSGWRRFHGFFR